MKPIAIFRHSPTEGPGFFAEYLDRCRITWKLIAIDAGDPVPADPGPFGGLAFMGGPMSVNDDLPWIPPVLDLIRAAAAEDIPLLGHCLGGQLMSRALGGAVTRNPTKEIGWGEIRIEDNPVARSWFGPDIRSFLSFHWHGETFSLPPGATRLMHSDHCGNQAFALGKHLGMQCHVEMTGQLIETWCESGQREIDASPGPAVQRPAQIRQDMDARVQALHHVATRLYDRWLEGVRR
ncbi:MAG: type 1 glutamine amidotransferase [Betaproteobacteria bacterium]|jgi:GMP synthase-like glutamine amidotransferase